jgi:hypothetical protein
MPIYSYGGKLLFSNQGAASVSQSCCCDDPPPPPECQGPCCVGGECLTTTPEECAAAGGTFYGCIYDCDDYPNLCSSPPSCPDLGCDPEGVRIESMIVTIDINEFDFDTSLQSCIDTYQSAWEAKAQELNGTYVLTKQSYFFGISYGFFYESGIPGEPGHVKVEATFTPSYENPQDGFPCLSKLDLLITSRTMSRADPYYQLDYFEGGVTKACYIPQDLRTEETYKVFATSANVFIGADAGLGWLVDMCDGQYLTPRFTGPSNAGNELSNRICGNFASGPNCDARHCIGFKYAGTADISLITE